MRSVWNYMLFMPYTEVKPVTPNDDTSMWITQVTTPLGAFNDNRQRYGIRIAVGNFVELMKWRRGNTRSTRRNDA